MKLSTGGSMPPKKRKGSPSTPGRTGNKKQRRISVKGLPKPREEEGIGKENLNPGGSKSRGSKVYVPPFKETKRLRVEEEGRSLSPENVPPKKRLSLSVPDDASVPAVAAPVSAAATEEALIDKDLETQESVRKLYESNFELFNANKINPSNAFNLRLLDCVDKMVTAPGFDRSNLALASRTVEVSTKIYSCRVANAFSFVLSAASNTSRQLNKKTVNNVGMEGGNKEGENDSEKSDGSKTGQSRQTNKGKRRRKFVEDDAKLIANFDNVEGTLLNRRTTLRKKFNEMVTCDLDFDYLSYFSNDAGEYELLEPDADLDSKLIIPVEKLHPSKMGRLHFLPFKYIPVESFDPERYDIWGIPNTEEDCDNYEPVVPLDETYAYNPYSRPSSQYKCEETRPTQLNETIFQASMFEGNATSDDGETKERKIQSLDELDEFYERAMTAMNGISLKYGWRGPNVAPAKSNRIEPPKPKTKRTKKKAERINFVGMDWDEKQSKYSSALPKKSKVKTTYDEEVIKGWKQIPKIEMKVSEELNGDKMMDVMGNEINEFKSIFKFFTNPRKCVISAKKPAWASFAEIEQEADFGQTSGTICTNVDEAVIDAFESSEDTPGSLETYTQNTVVLGTVAAKPKPIDMNNLKQLVTVVLVSSLHLNEDTGQPLEDNETKIDLAQLILAVIENLDPTTEKLLSVPLFMVALMHVVAEKKLMAIYDEVSDPECPVVLCPGRKKSYKDYVGLHFDD